jgi:tRNA A37 methylthiotransferase MiaB
MNISFREAMIGTKQEVLFEEEQDGMYVGHAPNYMKIYVKNRDLHNEIRTVIVEKIHKDGLFATEI